MSNTLGQKVRIRGEGGTVMTAKVDGGSGSVSAATAWILDETTGGWSWGSQWLNADNEIVIPDLFPDFTIFDIHIGLEFTTASAATFGQVRAEYQRRNPSSGVWTTAWAVNKGWGDINDMEDAVEDVYMGAAFHDSLKENWRARLRVWNGLDISINIVDAFISIASITTDPG